MEFTLPHTLRVRMQRLHWSILYPPSQNIWSRGEHIAHLESVWGGFFLDISEEMRSSSAPFAKVRPHRLEWSFSYFLCIRIVKVALKIFVSQFLPHFKVITVTGCKTRFFQRITWGFHLSENLENQWSREECSQTWADILWLGWPNLTLWICLGRLSLG